MAITQSIDIYASPLLSVSCTNDQMLSVDKWAAVNKMDGQCRSSAISVEEETTQISAKENSLSGVHKTVADTPDTNLKSPKTDGKYIGSRKKDAPDSAHVIIHPPQKSKGDKTPYPKGIPDTNFGLAVMVTLCFNLPFGVLAIYLSLTAAKAYVLEQQKKGALRARLSMIASLFGIVITVVVVVSLVLWSAMTKKKDP